MGWYAKELLKGTYKKTSKEKADHVVFTIEEMDEIDQELQQKLQQAEDKLAREKQRYKDREDEYLNESLKSLELSIEAQNIMVRDTQEKAQKEYDELNSDYQSAQNTIEELRAENRLLEEENERNTALNMHFKRVSRERANKENGQPKREGMGYVVISSSQYRDRVQDPDIDPGWESADIYIDVWKTVIRTHYNAALPLETIRREIRIELIDTVLGQLGVEVLQINSKNGIYEIWTLVDSDGREHTACAVYRWVYRANFRDDCWELELYHNTPIYVPEGLRPLNMKTKKSKGG